MISEARQRMLLVQELDDALRVILQSSLESREFKEGETITQEGEVVTSVFLITHGEVQVSRRGKDGEEVLLTELARGVIIGDMGLLMKGHVIEATVRAHGGIVSSVELPYSRLAEIKEKHPSLYLFVMVRFLSYAHLLIRQTNESRVRMQQMLMLAHEQGEFDPGSLDRVRMVHDVPVRDLFLFRDLNEESRRALLGIGRFREYQDKEVILGEGDEAYSFHLLLKGSVKILKEDGGDQGLAITRMAKGVLFGEMSLTSVGHTRSATVLAEGEVWGLEFSYQIIEDLRTRNSKLFTYLIERLLGYSHFVIRIANRGRLDVESALAFAKAQIEEGETVVPYELFEIDTSD